MYVLQNILHIVPIIYHHSHSTYTFVPFLKHGTCSKYKQMIAYIHCKKIRIFVYLTKIMHDRSELRSTVYYLKIIEAQNKYEFAYSELNIILFIQTRIYRMVNQISLPYIS